MLRANIKEALRSLASSKQRTALALLGIVIGIGSVIALVSTGTLVQRETMKQFKEMGTEVVNIQKAWSETGEDEDAKFRLSDIRKIPGQLNTIQEIAPYASSSGVLRIEGERQNVPVLGVTRSFLNINKLEVLKGRFITDLDYLMYQAVLGGNLADKLRQQGYGDLVGSDIYLDDRRFKVVGELYPASMGGMRPYEASEGLMIPISTAMHMDKQSTIRSILALKQPGVPQQQVQEELKGFFQQLPRPMKVEIRSAEQMIEHMEKQMQMFTLLLGAIGSISLVVGGVGVMNVMLVSVAERKKEIGIRRALGAQKKDIQGQFLMESVILSLIGGLLGILIGVGVSYGISRFSGWEFAVIYEAVFIGVGVSAAVGIFFGYYPARQASRLIPIQALRSD